MGSQLRLRETNAIAADSPFQDSMVPIHSSLFAKEEIIDLYW